MEGDSVLVGTARDKPAGPPPAATFGTIAAPATGGPLDIGPAFGAIAICAGREPPGGGAGMASRPSMIVCIAEEELDWPAIDGGGEKSAVPVGRAVDFWPLEAGGATKGFGGSFELIIAPRGLADGWLFAAIAGAEASATTMAGRSFG